MSNARKSFMTSQIKDVADAETIAECLGLDIQRKGNKISILCPSHDDQHHGSCFLTRKGFRCYACGARGDIIDLVQLANHSSFQEACEFICDIYGSACDFCTETLIPRKKLLDDFSLKLIGLERDSDYERVYITKAIIDDPIDPDLVLEPGERLKWEPSGSDKVPDRYILERLVSTNPLRDLLEHDETAYHELIARKAKEAAIKYRSMIRFAQNPVKVFDELDHDPEMLAMMYVCESVCREIGPAAWIREMEHYIRKCEDIRIEHSKGHTSTYSSKRNVFGKLSSSGVSI